MFAILMTFAAVMAGAIPSPDQAGGTAVPTFASSTEKYEQVWHVYNTELAKQCGDKHLEWLAPAELRDALDDYKQSASKAFAQKMTRAEKRECRNVVAGASCSNVADIKIAEQAHLIRQVTSQVCREYAQCREQSDCDRAGVPFSR
ncbi:hypothetical protein NRY95_05295 [Xanthomonas campestris pv. phormiicola]|nr:hypothetical protein [Xanthomonas campestris pv. phormiicola]UYC17378.1 hypothetical protein NRY95_05295 [Xanthomonas campestris pv. phormiicola]